jgi:hypothetical protein
MIPRLTFILTLMFAAVAAAGLFGRDRIRPSGKDTAAKEVASAEAAAPAAPILSAPLAPTAAAPQAPAAPAAPEPTARMTAAQEAGFDAWMIKAYLACWKPAPPPVDSDPYVAWVRLAFRPDGSLSKPPKLVNPPSDPALKPQAKSVIHALKACDPLPVPAQYRPFYEQWKTKTLHFSPQVAAR